MIQNNIVEVDCYGAVDSIGVYISTTIGLIEVEFSIAIDHCTVRVAAHVIVAEVCICCKKYILAKGLNANWVSSTIEVFKLKWDYIDRSFYSYRSYFL